MKLRPGDWLINHRTTELLGSGPMPFVSAAVKPAPTPVSPIEPD